MPRKYTLTNSYGGIGGNITTSRSDIAEVYKNLVTNHTSNRNITTKGLSSKRPGTRIINKLADTFNPIRIISWYKNIEENYLINFYKNTDSTDIGMIIYKKTGTSYTKLAENYSKDTGQTLISKYAAQALIDADVSKIQVLPYNDTMYITTGSSFPLRLSKDKDEVFTLNMWEGIPPMIQRPSAESVDDVATTLENNYLLPDKATALLYVREIPEDIEYVAPKDAEGDTPAVAEVMAVTYKKTIKLKETTTAPFWELVVEDATDDDIIMAAGIYVFDWYSPPNAVTAFRNSLVFGGSKLNASTIWASLPQKFNSFVINGKGIQTVALAEVFTLDTTLEILTLVAVEDYMVAFSRQETFFINRNLESRKQSGNGVSDSILPVLDNKNIYVVNNENELILWVWSGEINGGWQHLNLTQTNDIDLITGRIVNLAGFRYVDAVSTKRAEYIDGAFSDSNINNSSDDELIQVNYNNIMVLTEERLVGLNIIGNTILVNGEWNIPATTILDITSDYTHLYAQVRTSEGVYLLEFNTDFDTDFSTRAAGENYEKIITSYSNAGDNLTTEDLSGTKYNIRLGDIMTMQAKYTFLGRDIPLITNVEDARQAGDDELQIKTILSREKENDALGYKEEIKFDLGFYNLEAVLVPKINKATGSYVWDLQILPGDGGRVSNIYQQFDLFIRDRTTGIGGKLDRGFSLKYENLRFVRRNTKDNDIIGNIYPAELMFGIIRAEYNKVTIVFGATNSTSIGVTEQTYKDGNVAINDNELEKFMAYKYENYDTRFVIVFYNKILQQDKTAIIAASNDRDYENAFVKILNNDPSRTTYETIITPDTIVPDELNIKTVIDVVPPTVNIAVGGNVNREYIPYIIKGVNINIVHSDGVAVIKHKGGAISSIQTAAYNKGDYFGGSKRIQRSFQFKQGAGGNTARYRTLPFYSIEHSGRGKFIISDYTANLEV